MPFLSAWPCLCPYAQTEKADKPEKKKDKDAIPSSRPLPPPPDRGPAAATSKAAPKPNKARPSDYYAGLELPSSDDSDDDYERSTNVALLEDDEDKVLAVKVTGREYKKLADKERKDSEKAHQAKAVSVR